MKLIVPVESILQNLGGVILYDTEKNQILKQYVHNKKWIRVGWRGGKLFGDILIATDWNAIHYFDVKKWKYIKTFQRRTFNDLHYVEIRGKKLYVVNTGLDAIEIFKNPLEPEFLQRIFLFEKNKKIFKDRNLNVKLKYNEMMKQKPHSAHPNCISFKNKKTYVTCFGKNQKMNTGEIINLDNGKRMIKPCIDLHDGIFYEDDFYATWTRGSKIVIFKDFGKADHPVAPSKKIKIGGRGWWRGMVVNDSKIYVFASDGYRKKKTTVRMAIIDIITGTNKKMKLPIIDGVHWDTVYQPNIYED